MNRKEVESLKPNTFQIRCSNPACGRTYFEGFGNLAEAAKASMKYEGTRCDSCNSLMELWYNEIIEEPQYNKDHQYPDFNTDIRI